MRENVFAAIGPAMRPTPRDALEAISSDNCQVVTGSDNSARLSGASRVADDHPAHAKGLDMPAGD